MRRVIVVVSVALAGGCFTELPAMPGTGSDATTTGGTGSGSGTTTAGSTTAGTATSTPTPTTDVDPVTTGEWTSTSTGAPDEGLFACKTPLVCKPWDCSGGCVEPGEAGTCVLKALQDGATGALEVAQCGKDCALHKVLSRGAGTGEARWQSRLQDEPSALSEIRGCALKPAQFFADCLETFAPACADPAEWMVECATAREMCL